MCRCVTKIRNESRPAIVPEAHSTTICVWSLWCEESRHWSCRRVCDFSSTGALCNEHPRPHTHRQYLFPPTLSSWYCTNRSLYNVVFRTTSTSRPMILHTASPLGLSKFNVFRRRAPWYQQYQSIRPVYLTFVSAFDTQKVRLFDFWLQKGTIHILSQKSRHILVAICFSLTAQNVRYRSVDCSRVRSVLWCNNAKVKDFSSFWLLSTFLWDQCSMPPAQCFTNTSLGVQTTPRP